MLAGEIFCRRHPEARKLKSSPAGNPPPAFARKWPKSCRSRPASPDSAPTFAQMPRHGLQPLQSLPKSPDIWLESTSVGIVPALADVVHDGSKSNQTRPTSRKSAETGTASPKRGQLWPNIFAWKSAVRARCQLALSSRFRRSVARVEIAFYCSCAGGVGSELASRQRIVCSSLVGVTIRARFGPTLQDVGQRRSGAGQRWARLL